MSEPGVVPLLKVLLLQWVELTGASCHNMGISADSVSHVEIVYGVSQQAVVDLSLTVSSMGKFFEDT